MFIIDNHIEKWKRVFPLKGMQKMVMKNLQKNIKSDSSIAIQVKNESDLLSG